ncbi:hypothetical protein [Streptomyces graminofaciens]|nr:hypothetical protein [Streptomyces graminofaciens]
MSVGGASRGLLNAAVVEGGFRTGAGQVAAGFGRGPGDDVPGDSGKTAIIDAIRLCLLATAADFYRITRDDFHVGPDGRAGTFKITCGFKGLTTEEQTVFLSC